MVLSSDMTDIALTFDSFPTQPANILFQTTVMESKKRSFNHIAILFIEKDISKLLTTVILYIHLLPNMVTEE